MHLVSARKKKETFGQDTSGLRDLVTQCDNRSANIHRADAGRGSQDLLEAHLEHQRQKRRKVLEGLEGQRDCRAHQDGGPGEDLQVADSPGEESCIWQARTWHCESRPRESERETMARRAACFDEEGRSH